MAEQLTKQQQMAVDNRGGKLLVSAAAGSGKTKVLVDRLVSYVMDPSDPANIDDFLIITYTKAAAAELRGKIASKLNQLIAEDPANRHLRQQLQRLYLTKISTVHSFCGDVIREYAFNLDISPDFRVADETESSELQIQAIEKVLNDAYETENADPGFYTLIDTQGLGRDDRQIPQIVLKVFEKSRCHLDPDGWLQWCVDIAKTDGKTDAAETIWGKYLLDDLKRSLTQHISALTACMKSAQCAAEMDKPAQLLGLLVDQLQNLCNANTWDEVVARKDIDFGRLVFSKKIVDIDLAERIKAIRKSCKDCIEKKLIAFSDVSSDVLLDLSVSAEAACGLIELTKRFGAEYERRKRARRILDFGDLEHRMLDLLLGKHRSALTTVAKELGSRFREIMVDEYQDSNGVQDAIFDALTRKSGNCFMVGDVKQSIYQFRLADPDIFVDKYNAYLPAENAVAGEGRKIMLSNNFRSSAEVISAVNDVFSVCMSPKVGGLRYGDDERLYEGISHSSIGEPEVELYGIEVAEDTYAEEAAFVAQRITELLDGTHMVRQGDDLRAIKPEDIVILLRSPGSVGGEFANALAARGIRCVSGGSVDLLQTEEISALRSWLEIINNPLQDIPMIAVLAGRVVGLSANELAQIRSVDRHCSIYDAARKANDSRIDRFFDILSTLRMDARLYPLSELLQKIFIKTRLDSIYSAMPDGPSRIANLQMFCQAAADFESCGQRDLSQFLQYLSSLESRGLVYPSELQETGAVTIMSIHKSKGLEFPVVFLCGLSRRFNMENAREQVLCHKDFGMGLACVDAKNRVRYPTIAKRAISARIIEESISEELRVLYVAMTRPKDRLIMTYAANNLKADLEDIALRIDLSDMELLTSQVTCPGDWILQTAMRRTEAGQFFALGGHPDCVEVKQPHWLIQVVDSVCAETVISDTAQSRENIDSQIIGLLKESLAYKYPYMESSQTPSKQTATQLKGRAKDQEAAENTDQIRKHSFRKAGFSSENANAMDYGTAMHSVLRYIDFKACVDMSGVSGELKRLLDAGVITPEQKTMVSASKILALLETPIGKRISNANELLREFKFSILVDAPNLAIDTDPDQVLLQGVVDCAIVYDDGITVVDYKTDNVTDETIAERVKQYTPQVKAYADALERIFKLPIKSTVLYFFKLNKFIEI